MPRIVALSLLAIGLIAGFLVFGAYFGVARAEAASVEQRWAYFCFEAATVQDINAKANAAGLRGWEMAAASPSDDGTIWCFRQRKP